jgi:hypothetical protein
MPRRFCLERTLAPLTKSLEGKVLPEVGIYLQKHGYTYPNKGMASYFTIFHSPVRRKYDAFGLVHPRLGPVTVS